MSSTNEVTTNDAGQSLVFGQIAKEPGIADLRLPVRGPFAKAIKAERLGDHALAEAELIRAIAAEAAL